MTRALVTGGAGFIGSHLVDALLGRGYDVEVLDDFSTGQRENLRDSLSLRQLQLTVGDVRERDVVDEVVRRADIVYHLAAAVGVRRIVADPLGTMLTNVRGTENVLASAFAARTPVLLASTSEVYGRSTRTPFREDTERVLGPTWVPRWSYSTAKAIDEHFAFAYAEKGLPVTVVRYFNSYGPRIDERGYGSVVARFIGQALVGAPITVHGDGLQTRCFTYVTDTVDGTIRAAESPNARGKAINIGSAEEVTITALAHLIRDLTASESRIEHVTYESYYGPSFEDTRRRLPDIEMARTQLGFVAGTRLEDGLRETIDWCKQNFALKR